MSRFLKAGPDQYLDEPIDSDASTAILESYDRGAIRTNNADEARTLLERIEALQATVDSLAPEIDELTKDVEDFLSGIKTGTAASVLPFPDIDAISDRIYLHLRMLGSYVRGMVPEAIKARSRGNQQDTSVRVALRRSRHFGKSWKFVAALLFDSGRIKGNFGKVYDRIRKLHSSIEQEDKLLQRSIRFRTLR